MQAYYLGIDVGATKSHALIADQNGQALGFGQAGPGNHEVVGWEGHQTVLQEITRQALVSAGIDRGQIAGAGFGLAGYDWPSQRQPHLQAIANLGLGCPVELVNDAIIGLLAGASQGWGIALIGGTGENCWGVDRQRNYGHMTGNSALMGEYGGAGSIVYRALRDVAKAWGKRGPDTALSQAFIQRTGAVDLDDLLEGLVMGNYSLHAGDAPLVFEVARAGDAIAVEAIRWAAVELADQAKGVIRQLGFEEQEFEVVLTGSTFKGGPLYIEPLRAAILELAPGAKLVRLEAPPVVGGVLLGMEQTDFDGYTLRQALIKSTQRYLG